MMNDCQSRYTITIQWSDEDHCFIASLPEWGEFCHTHGATYEAAIANAQEVLDMLIESAIANHEPLPVPQMYRQRSAATVAA